jgi:hypothetical protein
MRKYPYLPRDVLKRDASVRPRVLIGQDNQTLMVAREVVEPDPGCHREYLLWRTWWRPWEKKRNAYFLTCIHNGVPIRGNNVQKEIDYCAIILTLLMLIIDQLFYYLIFSLFIAYCNACLLSWSMTFRRYTLNWELFWSNKFSVEVKNKYSSSLSMFQDLIYCLKWFNSQETVLPINLLPFFVHAKCIQCPILKFISWTHLEFT